MQPKWQGEATECGTLLIYAEQGFGDTLQFARFAELAVARGWHVIIEVPPALCRLAGSLPGVAQVVARGEALPPFDRHCAMLSLPLALQTTLETIPAAVPYLAPDPRAAATWRTRLDGDRRHELRVGVAWAGSPRMAPDRRRSITPEQLAPLFEVSGVQFFSLQKLGPAAPATLPLTNVTGELTDFADTAALMVNLDLVITVDTAVAHLAGALGKPVWLLDRFDACWRWLPGRRDATRTESPWYPTMRLFRQTAPGDWAGVLREVVSALRRLTRETVVRADVNLPAHLAAAHLTAAWAHQREGRLQEAAALCRAVLAADRRHDGALHLLGLVACLAGQTRQGVGLIRHAIARDPTQPMYQANLGAALLQAGALDESATWCRRAVALRPDDAQAHNSLGAVLREQGHKNAAMTCFQRAIRCQPDLAEAHYNLSREQLALGDFSAGWRGYEWRWRTAYFRSQAPALTQPRWSGELAAGQTVLLHAEQGFGDTLQFCRYAPLLAATGVRIVLEVPTPLVRLIRSLSGVAEVVAQGGTRPEFDLHCPMMSLLLALGTTLSTIPAAAPYLHADPSAVMYWAARLDAISPGARRVGLAWAGAPSITVMDRQRSMSPEYLAPLLSVPNVQFVSLQKDGPPAPFPLVDLMGEMTDFADTAALIANLDLVIAVDTAVVHLAGALGKKVWMLDRFDPCWRWLTDRTTSPWYPNMRIYRQQQRGAWGAVVAAVVRDLTTRGE